VDEAVSMAQSAADPDTNIIFGSVVDESLGDEVRITVIATGFQGREADRRTPARAAQVQVQVQAQAAAVKAAPPPLPVEVAKAKEPIRLAQPIVQQPAPVIAARTTAQPVVARPVVRREAYKPAETDDQYDIPAFLRRGGGGNGAPPRLS
jgi:cell division protein FtsZ